MQQCIGCDLVSSSEAREKWTWNVSHAYKTTCRINSVNVRDRHYLTSALLTRAAFSAIFLLHLSLSPLLWVRCSVELSFKVESPFTELNKIQCIKNGDPFYIQRCAFGAMNRVHLMWEQIILMWQCRAMNKTCMSTWNVTKVLC